ncbi:HAD-like domain-containing protein [Chytriomyces cf. hyalinus JEL632]|nr:HAD-like domain-containing protein [Chytriomyces cf. hyalinus JEL632]
MSKRKLLVVLDLNGTLVDRLTKQHERKMASQNALCPKHSDLTLERCRVFLRPYLDVFLRFLLDNFHVAVWTSAVSKNAHPMTEFIMEPFGGAEALEFVWNLSMSFTSSHVWDETNTILLDDSASKSCRTPLNHLLIPTFSVWDLKATPNCDQDTTLLATMSYLKSLLKSHDNEKSCTDSISDGSEKAAWSVRKFLTQTPLYVATPEEKIELVSKIHAAELVEESMLQQRHRGGGDKELLGKTPFTVFEEWHPHPSDFYIDRTGDRPQWTDDKRYSVKKPNTKMDDERVGRRHNGWAGKYQRGPSDGVVQSGDNQGENTSGDGPNGPSEDAPPSEPRLSRKATKRLRKEAAQQKAQAANGTQVVEPTMPESNKSVEVVESKEENEVGTGAPRVKRKRPNKKRGRRMNYEEGGTPSKKKRQASPAGGGEGSSGQDDRSIFSICSAM